MILLWLTLVLWVVWLHCQQTATGVCTQENNTTEPAHTQPPAQEEQPPFLGIDQNGSTIPMKVGETISVSLPGNATTGYMWRIVRMDGGSVQANPRWQYRLEKPVLVGSGGMFDNAFRAVQPGQTEVYFLYDPVADPQLGYDYFLRFDVRAA